MARLPYLDAADLAAEHRDLLNSPINIRRALAHSPGALQGFIALAVYLRHESPLDPRLRELAIIQVGYVSGAAYEYGHHIEIGARVGVTDEDLRSIARETAGESSNLPPLDRAVLRAAREMTDGTTLSRTRPSRVLRRRSIGQRWSTSLWRSPLTTGWCAFWARSRSTSSRAMRAISKGSHCLDPAALARPASEPCRPRSARGPAGHVRFRRRTIAPRSSSSSGPSRTFADTGMSSCAQVRPAGAGRSGPGGRIFVASPRGRHEQGGNGRSSGLPDRPEQGRRKGRGRQCSATSHLKGQRHRR